MRDDSRIFSSGGPCEQLWHGQGCPLFDVVHPAFLVPTSASPTLQGSLKDGFGEAVVTCDMQEPCKFLSLDSCQKRFLWTHKEVALVLLPVVGLVLQVEDAEKFPEALGLENLDPFLGVSEQGPCLNAIKEDGGDKRLAQLQLDCKSDSIASPDPVQSYHR